MKIIVTQADIQDGVRRDASNCAVARALRRSGVSHAGVAGTLVLLANGGHHQYVVLPGRVQDWIAEFDNGGKTEPIEFELALPDWAIEHRQEPAQHHTIGYSKPRTRPQHGFRQGRPVEVALEA